MFREDRIINFETEQEQWIHGVFEMALPYVGFSFCDQNGVLTAHGKRAKMYLLKKINDRSISSSFELKTNIKNNMSEFISGITNNETWFFRNKKRNDALAEYASTELVLPIRVLVNPCSNGSEACSFASSCRDNFGNQYSIDACDIDESIITKAEKGEYTQNEFGRGLIGVSKEEMEKVLYWDKNIYRVRDRIKNKIRYRVGSIIDNPAGKKYDVVICRNLLIYFHDLENIKRIAQNIAESLVGGGVFDLAGEEVSKMEEVLGEKWLSGIGLEQVDLGRGVFSFQKK